MNVPGIAIAEDPTGERRLAILKEIERKLLWLSAWAIHNANHVRPNRDGLKVGGHQASSSSVISIMTALYFAALRPEDRVAVKPHAGPVFHAANYLLGRERSTPLERLRAFGGAQSYPSRARDGAEVDFSTGSVGLGVALTSFAALMQDYVHRHGFARADVPAGRSIALAGDAELDEGNIYEALLEGWKHDVRDLWWIIDYNRQSLDSVVPDRLFGRIEGLFRDMGWNVVTLKYGRKLAAAFARPGGEKLRRWIDDCPNSLYSALTFQGGAAWRAALLADLGRDPSLRTIIDPLADSELGELMTNLGGHDLAYIIDTLEAAAAGSDQPTCFIAYTIKGMGLPFAGHKDNHSGLMTAEQMESFRGLMQIRPGHEWDIAEGLAVSEGELRRFIAEVPFARTLAPEGRALVTPAIPVPEKLPAPGGIGRKISTQAGFGEILAELGRGEGACGPLAERILTTSPDVTVSTNLGPWVNRRGIFDRHTRNDVFRDAKLASAQRWGMSPRGQHFELGIAEQNLFLLLGAAGLAHALYGARLIPIGTVYDPFVNRGLDALIYACYQDARFLLVSTPSGISLAPEGGQHQSINTPLIGMALDRLAAVRAGTRGRAGDPAPPRLRAHAASGRLCRVAPAFDAPDHAAAARAGCGRGDRRRALGFPARARRAHRARLSGTGGARGAHCLRDAARGGTGGRAARGDEPGAAARGLARGTAGAARRRARRDFAHRTRARATRGRCDARFGAGRASGRAFVAAASSPRRQTWTIIGLPAISASALPGRRVKTEARRNDDDRVEWGMQGAASSRPRHAWQDEEGSLHPANGG